VRPARPADTLGAIVAACRAIEMYAADDTAPERLVHDAIRMRLADIAVAVGTLPADVTAHEPRIPWTRLVELRDRVVDGSPEASPTVVRGTAVHDVPRLRAAATRLRHRLTAS
jgi:uncharacterized protein with HEPN domain